MTHVDSFVLLLGVLPGSYSEVGLWEHSREATRSECFDPLWAEKDDPLVRPEHQKIWDTSRTHVRWCREVRRSPVDPEITWVSVSNALVLWRIYF